MKLAERLVLQIDEAIRAAGKAHGDLLGSEADLVGRFGTSRWTLREALTLLERDGRIEVRRGRNGGVFVAERGLDAVVLTLWSYLEFVAVGDDEILVARSILDRIVLTLAEQRATIADVARLRTHLEHDAAEGFESGVHQFEALLDTARNPLATVLVRAIGQLGFNAILRSSLSDAELDDNVRQTRHLRRRQIEAVIGGDLPAALALEERILRQTRRLLGSARSSSDAEAAAHRDRAVRLLGQARRFKRPELLMHEIAADIVAQGQPVDARLGSEADLLARYGVSRTVFREAVRALERNGIVAMRTGRNSGLFVVAPDPTSIVAIARERIAAAALGAPALIQVLAPLLSAAIGLADPDRLSSIEEGDFLDLIVALARSSGNRILGLFTALLAGVLRDLGPELDRAIPALRAACRSGDRALVVRIVLCALGDCGSARAPT